METNDWKKEDGKLYLKNTSRNFKSSIRCDNLSTSNPLCNLTSLSSSDVTILPIFVIQARKFYTSAVGQSFSGSEMGEVVPVAFEDVEFLCCRF
jgi:hypothetical protein